MWNWNDSVRSRMTPPKPLTWGKGGGSEELSMSREKLPTLESVDLVPMRRTLFLLLFSFRRLEVNQDLILDKHKVRQEGGRVELALLEG